MTVNTDVFTESNPVCGRQSSAAELFRSLSASEQIARIESLTDAEAYALLHDWSWHARPGQIAPDWDWRTWLIMAGRGYGKTRTGSEWVRAQVAASAYVNLICATADDARDIMVEGESGILAICPKSERPEYQPSKRKLAWPNGANSLIFTADEPERLRGKQHSKLWCDELCSWRYPESWTQAMLGLRLGRDPQVLVTTTPRPTTLIKELIKSPTTAVTRGTTYENRANLPAAFFDEIIKRYEGTRLGRQELNAELLLDNPAALWQRDVIDRLRITAEAWRIAPVRLRRIVVAIDPAVTSNADSDMTGIVVAGIAFHVGAEPAHCYVLADVSLSASPDRWARAAVTAYYQHRADRIVAEVNNGGDLVETVIRTIDRSVPYRKIHASRGKAIRAEPIAALYEQGRVHHVGSFPELEDQMCDFDPTIDQPSPDRMDALVWCLSELTQGVSGQGIITELRL